METTCILYRSKICVNFYQIFFIRPHDNCESWFSPAVTSSEEPKDVRLVSVPNELLVMQKACHCNKSVLTVLRVPSKCSGVVLSKCSGLLLSYLNDKVLWKSPSASSSLPSCRKVFPNFKNSDIKDAMGLTTLYF